MPLMNPIDSLWGSRLRVRPGSRDAYLAAVFAVGAATILRLAVDPWVSGVQFITFFPAVMITTFFCGVRAGIFSVALAVLSAWYFIEPPRFSFQLANVGMVLELAGFALLAMLNVAIVGFLRAALERVAQLMALEKAIFESNPDAILVADAQGRIVRTNERAATLFGYAPETLIGLRVEALIPERFRDRQPENRASFLAEPHHEEMASGLELFGLRQGGSEFPVDVQIGRIEGVDDPRMIATIRDMTEAKATAAELAESRRRAAILEERQRNAEELRKSNEKLSRVIDGAPDAICEVDAEGRITMWNPAAVEIYGVAAAQAVGSLLVDVLSGQCSTNGTSPAGLIERVLREGGFEAVEMTVEADGRTTELSVSAGLLLDSAEKVTGILFMMHDVGRAKELERHLREVEKIEALGQLTGGIAHDFNNLLAVITGNLELAEEASADRPEVREMLVDAMSAAGRGVTLTRSLLAYSRRQPLAPRATDVSALLRETTAMLRRTVPENVGIDLVAESTSLCKVDPGQLQNAILNLALNARDAMPHGGTLTLEARDALLDERDSAKDRDVIPGEYVTVAVSDDGAGMPAEVLGHVFEPFFTTKEVGKGTGLGLSMVYGFVKQSGGLTRIESEPGKGTTVKIYLPRCIECERSPAPPPPPEARGRGEVVLVVEDDTALRKLTVREVCSLGYRAEFAEDGAAALRRLENTTGVAVLLTDIIMPGGMNGWQLGEVATARCPGLKVVYMSGYTEEVTSDGGRVDPDVQLLYKPFHLRELARQLAIAVESRAASGCPR